MNYLCNSYILASFKSRYGAPRGSLDTKTCRSDIRFYLYIRV